MSKWNDARYSNDELADILSDYHKDVHGFRLRLAGSPRAEMVEEILTLLELLIQAEADSRDQDIQQLFEDQEYADWSADLDAQHYATI
tara:strand:- start:397 stop:660 length:264 start_codon:yes stop_codon:yes gene_type:complete